MSTRRTYMRPMDGWWRRDPFFIRYMWREGTAVFVVLYALLLLATVVRLALGDESFGRWAAFLHTGVAVLLHVVLLLAFLYHTWSWFQIMPKTLPPIKVGGERLSAAAITSLGLAAAAFCSIVLLVALALFSR